MGPTDVTCAGYDGTKGPIHYRVVVLCPTVESFVASPAADRSNLMPVSAFRMDSRNGAGGDATEQDMWLRAFHGGERACLERCYRDHLTTVDQVVAGVLHGADRETLVHEVFFRLLSDSSLRRAFHGGSFASWLRVVARNQAIDYARRRRLELRFLDTGAPVDTASTPPAFEQELDVQWTLQRFRERCLPTKWRAVFDTRFVALQDQPTAARAIGISRTTLAYQEHRIRRLLRRFVMRGESK